MLGSTSITFNGKTLYKIDTPSHASEYLFKDATEQYVVKVRHTKTNAGSDRHNVEVSHTVWEVPGTSPEINRKSYVILEQLPADEDDGLLADLCAFLTASTNAVIAELFDWRV